MLYSNHQATALHRVQYVNMSTGFLYGSIFLTDIPDQAPIRCPPDMQEKAHPNGQATDAGARKLWLFVGAQPVPQALVDHVTCDM